jgi:HK97 family phage prohead protease
MDNEIISPVCEKDKMAIESDKRFQKGNMEYRSVEMKASFIDAAEEGKSLLKVLEGRAIVFDKPTPLFQDYDGTTYYEQIHRDALQGVDLSNVVLKYNHSEHVPPLASTKAGTLDLRMDQQGLNVTARMANTTQANDIHELVRTGHLDKMSFAFTVANDAYDTKTRTRTIFKFDKMYDVSVVDFPAYEQTSVSARSYIQAQQEVLRLEQERHEQEAELQRQQAKQEAEDAKNREAEEARERQAQMVKRQQLILKTML